MLTTCRLSIGGVALFYFYVLDNAYELSRYYNREQRIYDASKRYVAQGKQKHYKVAGKVHGLYFQPQEPRKAHRQCVITTGTENGKHLLLVKDSFANSFVPFLTGDYETITMLDLRYFRGSVQELAAEADDILVLYEITNFAADGNLFKLNLH